MFIEIPTDPEGRLRVVGRNTGRVYYEHGDSSKDNSGIKRGTLPKRRESTRRLFGIIGLGGLTTVLLLGEYVSNEVFVVGIAAFGTGIIAEVTDHDYPVLILPGQMYLRAPEHVLQRAARASGATVSLQNPLRPLPAIPKYTLGLSPMRRGEPLRSPRSGFEARSCLYGAAGCGGSVRTVR